MTQSCQWIRSVRPLLIGGVLIFWYGCVAGMKFAWAGQRELLPYVNGGRIVPWTSSSVRIAGTFSADRLAP